jgi:hypothetical protein
MPITHRTCCVDRTGLKTKISCVVLTLVCHFLIGSLFSYPADDSNLRFQYPNLGSSLFVLSVSLYCTSRSLHPKFLCIQSGYLQTIYKILMVIIITNILLVAVWQQLVSLAIEFVLILHDIFKYCRLPCGYLVATLGCYLSHMMGMLMLLWVLTNIKCLFTIGVNKNQVLDDISTQSDDSLDIYFTRNTNENYDDDY